MQVDRQERERRGRRAERLAAMFLRLKGYRILERRYKTPIGEIDLVARRGRRFAFVEVKARQTRDAAMTSVSQHQRRRIVGAAELWLAAAQRRNALPDDFDTCFDMMLVVPNRIPYHLSDIFDAN